MRYKILDEYIEMIQSKITFDHQMTLAMDSGNAAACLAAPSIFKGLGADLTELFCDVDGNFPNHHPDPTVTENLTELISTVKGGNFDAGLAYDGDADRIGLVDEKGEIVFADQIMALMLPEIVNEGDEILFDVKCSQALEEEIIRLENGALAYQTENEGALL